MLGEYLNEFIIAYLDNIIIYSNSKEEHFQYIKLLVTQGNSPITTTWVGYSDS